MMIVVACTALSFRAAAPGAISRHEAKEALSCLPPYRQRRRLPEQMTTSPAFSPTSRYIAGFLQPFRQAPLVMPAAGNACLAVGFTQRGSRDGLHSAGPKDTFSPSAR